MRKYASEMTLNELKEERERYKQEVMGQHGYITEADFNTWCYDFNHSMCWWGGYQRHLEALILQETQESCNHDYELLNKIVAFVSGSLYYQTAEMETHVTKKYRCQKCGHEKEESYIRNKQ